MKKAMVLMGLLYAIEVHAVCHSNEERVTYDITTGSSKGTYFEIGLNLAKYVAPDACIKLKVLNSNGSMDNATKLNSPNNIKFAIVQNDVLQELIKISREGRGQKRVMATNLVQNLRVIAPLYNEEIHIISDVKSDINTFGDLKDKRISIGKQKSGTAMTSYLLYKELFGEELRNSKTQSFDKALKDLEYGNIDAIIKVAGQPVPRLSKEMNKNSGKYLKLVTYNEKNSNHQPIENYYTADIKDSSYAWIDRDVPTLSTKAYLITYNYSNMREKKYIKKFVESLRARLPYLKQNATKDNKKTPHEKWKEVSDECAPSLPSGWQYYSVVNEVCNGIISPTPRPINNSTNRGCSQRDYDTGVCKR